MYLLPVLQYGVPLRRKDHHGQNEYQTRPIRTTAIQEELKISQSDRLSSTRSIMYTALPYFVSFQWQALTPIARRPTSSSLQIWCADKNNRDYQQQLAPKSVHTHRTTVGRPVRPINRESFPRHHDRETSPVFPQNTTPTPHDSEITRYPLTTRYSPTNTSGPETYLK